MPDPFISPETPATESAQVAKELRLTALAPFAALGVPLLVLLALVLFLLNSAHWVDHSERVIAQANYLERLLVSMQASGRGYLLSHEAAQVNEITTLQQRFIEESRTLSRLVSDSPAQLQRVEGITAQAQAWITFAQRQLTRVDIASGSPAMQSTVREGSARMAALMASVDEIVSQELQLRRDREGNLHGIVAAIFVTLGLLMLAGIPALSIWIARRLNIFRADYQENLALAQKRARELQITLQSIGDAVVATDAAGRVAFLNSTAEKLTGWLSAEAQGHPLEEVFEIFNEQTGERVENPVDRVLQENIIVGLANHTILRARDGREHPIEDSAAPIRGQDGSVQGVILVFHDVVEKRNAARRLEDSESRLRFLNELGDATRELMNPVEIMNIATAMLGERLRVSRCAYADVEADGNNFTIQEDYTHGCTTTKGRYQLDLFGPKAAADMRGGRTLILRDVSLELAPEEGAAAFQSINVAAIVCCPLVKEGRLRAMMAVHHTTPRTWSYAEVLLVEEVVERCWATIQRARAEAEALERAQLSALRAEVAENLSSAGELNDSLQRCCELLVRHVGAAFARIWITDAAEPVLVLRASAGIYTHLDGGHARVRIGDFKIGRIAQSQQAHLTNDVPHDPNVSDQEWARREGMVAFAGYPLLVEGRVLGVMALFAKQPLSENVLRDLTPVAGTLAQHIDRKHSEVSLLESEKIKTAILNTALDGFVLMDHEGYIRDWNKAAEKIYLASRKETIGRLLSEVMVPEELREMHRKGLQHYLKTGEGKVFAGRLELPSIRCNGERFPCEISITRVPATEPPLFAGYVRDITERKQVELALRQAVQQAKVDAQAVIDSTERFRLLAEVTSLQVWTALPDGRLDFVNKQCLLYFGATEEAELLGHAWADRVHPEDRPLAETLWGGSLSSGTRYETEFRLIDTTGEYRWFLVRAEPLRDDSGRIVKWFGTNTEIHALKSAQSAAEQASRAKDDFLAALSHELRTPLNPVLMTAASLREDTSLPKDIRDQLGMIERNIALEARLIDDLLDLTRIARGKLSLRTELCDAHSLIGLAVEIVRDDAFAKGISLRPHLSARNSGVVADPARFQQVIWNLLRNAVKFTPPGGHISIRTEDHDENWLRIQVTDSGVGIDSEELHQIFRPFEQGARAGDHRFGGLGLGLAIARAVVDLHGGRIIAQSTGTNQGATFVVDLPGAAKPPHGVATGSPEADPALEALTLHPKRSLQILLVEDHLPTLQVLQRLLARESHTVTVASSISEALSAASSKSFDIVISDLGLPDGTGNELMQHLRDRYQLPGIALSGYGMEEDIVRSRQAGFSLHLIKPVDFVQLRRALNTIELGDPELG